MSTNQMHFHLFKAEIHTIESCKQSKVTKVSTIYLAKSKCISCGTILSTQESQLSNYGPINFDHFASFRSSQCLGLQGYNNRPDQSVFRQLKCRHLFIETAVDKWPKTNGQIYMKKSCFPVYMIETR